MADHALSLNSLHLVKGARDNEYRGTVEFMGQQGKIALHLDAALAEQVLQVVAEELIATAERLATQMTASLIQQASALEAITGSAEISENATREAKQAVAAGVRKRRRASNGGKP